MEQSSMAVTSRPGGGVTRAGLDDGWQVRICCVTCKVPVKRHLTGTAPPQMDSMTTSIAIPKVRHPSLPVNALGLTRRDYEGAMSTGYGHDSITAASCVQSGRWTWRRTRSRS
jgi:hypothetical protein